MYSLKESKLVTGLWPKATHQTTDFVAQAKQWFMKNIYQNGAGYIKDVAMSSAVLYHYQSLQIKSSSYSKYCICSWT